LENVVGFEKHWSADDGDGDGDDGDDVDDMNIEDDKAEQKQQKSTTTTTEENTNDNKNNNVSNTMLGSFQTWRKVLSLRQYQVAHFHLDPTHLGLPNNRPRHYTVAFRPGTLAKRLRIGSDNGLAAVSSSSPTTKVVKQYKLFQREELDKPPIIYNEQSLQQQQQQQHIGEVTPLAVPCISSILDSKPNVNPQQQQQELLQIPEKLRKSSSSWCFDIVTPNHRRSACFTHSYGKFIRGTGSILYTGPLEPSLLETTQATTTTATTSAATVEGGAADEAAPAPAPAADRFQLQNPEERTFDATWSEDIDWQNDMRYFSGNEIARLMGFPVAELPAAAALMMEEEDASSEQEQEQKQQCPVSVSSHRKFSFPEDVVVKRQWKLLGNSLNVRVAACVAEIGIRSALLNNELGE